MKKSFILILLIIIVGIFLVACERESVTYCPFCQYSNVKEVENGVFQCQRASCGKKFYAQKL